MAIRKVNYSRDFTSITQRDSPECLKITQETSEEDDSIRKEIREKFDYSCGEGFDGKQMYNYCITGKPKVPVNTLENVKYTTTFFITKAGTLKDISKNCELEEFLLIKGFKKIEVEN